MTFFSSTIDVLQTLVIALGAGLGRFCEYRCDFYKWQVKSGLRGRLCFSG